MGPDIGSGDNRWQGYSHRQLYDMLRAGPGPAAAGVTADRWSAMAGALADIQQDISAGISASGASWVGAAAEAAHGALNPLGDWAQQASSAAEVMRISAELQGDLLSKARAAMPAPVPIPVQPNAISQLVTAQVDYEMTEIASHVAEQQAFQVMAQYESGTVDNTSTLGEFEQPPALRVDTTPITGGVVRGRVRVAGPPRRLSRPSVTGRAGGSPPVTESGGGRSTGGVARTAPVEEIPPESPAVAEPAGSTPAVAEPAGPPAVTEPAPAAASAPSSPSASPGPSTPRATSSTTTDVGATAPSSAAPTAPSSSGPLPSQPTGTSRDHTDGGAASVPRIGGVVPAARRADRDDEPDAEHESKYFIEAEDIYGDRQSYSPPVIGEHR